MKTIYQKNLLVKSLKHQVLIFLLFLLSNNLTAKTFLRDFATIRSCSSTENLPITFTQVAIISPLCCNSSNGSIQISVSGGVSPYSYLWNNGQTAVTAVNLSAGNYTVTVTDAGLYSITGNWQVIAPPAMSIIGSPKNLTCSGEPTGEIGITVNGGTPGYSYKWNVYGSQGQGTAHVSGLFAGTYTVTVTDSHSCTKIQSWQISQPASLLANGAITNISCYGGNNGTASLTGTGGTSPYTYHWSTGSTSQQITGLTPGSYTVTTTDASNCFTLNWFTINQPTDITITGTPSPVACISGSGGQITTTINGGSGGANTYLWNNGQTGPSATNLTAGTYTVTVTNIAGCTKSGSFNVTESVSMNLTAVAIISPLCCNSSNGSIQISVSCGVSPYTYLWNNGQTAVTAVNLSAG
ncbi:MAG: SprB repeat-containing protein, partial [Bacteroidota bacterium]